MMLVRTAGVNGPRIHQMGVEEGGQFVASAAHAGDHFSVPLLAEPRAESLRVIM